MTRLFNYFQQSFLFRSSISKASGFILLQLYRYTKKVIFFFNPIFWNNVPDFYKHVSCIFVSYTNSGLHGTKHQIFLTCFNSIINKHLEHVCRCVLSNALHYSRDVQCESLATFCIHVANRCKRHIIQMQMVWIKVTQIVWHMPF
jgi:hypothetical protein